MTIRNPIEWSYDHLRLAASGMGVAVRSIHAPGEHARPAIRHLGIADLRVALAKGIEDFAACRTDVIFIGLAYPVIGLVLWRLVIGRGMFPLLFPLASGFALVGPFLAIGLYEMSRRRELGMEVSWADAFGVLSSRASGAIALLGILLMAIFVLWLFAAEAIYHATLGPAQPGSFGWFLHDVFTTGAGWTLMAAGIGVGFLFAVLVLTISVVSFPLLLDRQEADLGMAIGMSVRTVLANKRIMALWGAMIAGGLVLGSIPCLLGLAFVVPVFGHATWHLYRRAVMV